MQQRDQVQRVFGLCPQNRGAGVGHRHYAQLEQRDGRVTLSRRGRTEGPELFFCAHSASASSRTRCSRSVRCKSSRYADCQARGLPNANKKDSTGICFYRGAQFCPIHQPVRCRAPPPGDMVERGHRQVRSGRQPRGLCHYTLGQRGHRHWQRGQRESVVRVQRIRRAICSILGRAQKTIRSCISRNCGPLPLTTGSPGAPAKRPFDCTANSAIGKGDYACHVEG